LQVQPDGTNRHLVGKVLLDQRLHRSRIPQRERQLLLIWRLVHDVATNPVFLGLGQLPSIAERSAPFLLPETFPGCRLLDPATDRGPTQAQFLSDRHLGVPALMQSYRRTTQLLTRRRLQFSGVYTFAFHPRIVSQLRGIMLPG